MTSPPSSSTLRDTSHRSSGSAPPPNNSFLSFDGLYNCQIVHFSKMMSQNIDFESVEAVGLKRKNDLVATSSAAAAPNNQNLSTAENASFASTTSLSSAKQNQHVTRIDIQQQGGVSPSSSSAAGVAGAGSAAAAAGSGPASTATLATPPSSLGLQPKDSTLSSSFVNDMAHQDSITMFEASPLSDHLPASAGANPAAGAAERSERSLATIVRHIHSTIDTFEAKEGQRFWLFRHAADEGVSLFMFTHVSDLIAFIIDKVPEITEPWGGFSSGVEEEEEEQEGHHHHQQQQHHHHQSHRHRHHDQQQRQRHPEEDAEAAEADQNAAAFLPPDPGAPSKSKQQSRRRRGGGGGGGGGGGENSQKVVTTADDNAGDFEAPPAKRESTLHETRRRDTAEEEEGEEEEELPSPNGASSRTTHPAAAAEVEAAEAAADQDEGDEEDGDEGFDDADRSSHSSSTMITSENGRDVHFWLDLQIPNNPLVLLEILRLFPSLRKETYESFINATEKHSVRHFSHHGYLCCIYSASAHSATGEDAEGGFLVVDEASPTVAGKEAAALEKNPHAMQLEMERDNKLLATPPKTKCCVVASRQLAITFHQVPIRGLSQTVKRLTYAFRKRTGAAGGNSGSGNSSRPQQEQQRMTSGWILSTLFVSSVVNQVPSALSSITTTIETMDAKILLASVAADDALSSSPLGGEKKAATWFGRWWSGSGSSSSGSIVSPSMSESTNPFMLRVARYRRSIAEFKAALSRKEHLTSLLTSPKMAGIPYMRDAHVRLHDVLPLLQRHLTQLDQLRELLTQSHANLLSQISLQQAQTSNALGHDMAQLSVVATVTLPLGLLVALFGVNVPIPWQSSVEYQSLVPFAVIVGLIVFWTIASLLYAKFVS